MEYAHILQKIDMAWVFLSRTEAIESSERKIGFHIKEYIYQTGFLGPLRVFVVDGGSFTSFKFESKYVASLVLVRIITSILTLLSHG